MKRIVIFITLILALLMCMASCTSVPSSDSKSEHTHEFGEWFITKNATCAEDGVKVRYCSCGEKQSETIPSLSHNVAIDEVIEPTCTKAGLTEGKHCSTCNEVIVAQTTVNALGHTEATVPGKAPTCTETGLTDGVKCNTCGETLVEHTDIPANGHFDVEPKDYVCDVCDTDLCTVHVEDPIDGKAPTCTATGLTEGKKCSICGDILEAQTVVDALGHDEQACIAKAPTCTEIGWDAYVTCSRCTYTTYVEKGALGHSYTSTVTAPTATEDGLTTYHCSVCSDSYAETITSVDFTVTFDNKSQIGYTGEIGENLVIPAVFQNDGIWYRVTSIGSSAFYDCYSLTSIIIPDSVTSIGNWAFDSCFNLSSLVIGDSVTSIGGYAFSNCFSLSSITIPDSVTSIFSYAFSNCYSLTSVVIGNSVTSIGDSAFSGCYKLVEVINKSLLNITKGSSNYGYIAYYAHEVHNSESKIVNVNDYLFYTYDGVNYLIGYVGDDTELVLPEDYNGENYEIHKDAFYYCSSLTSITIPDSVTSIGDSAFQYCYNLTSVKIGNSVTSIGDSAFFSCYKLVEVVNKSASITVTKGTKDNGYVGFSAFAVYNSGDEYTTNLSNDNGYIIYTDGEEKILVGYTGSETDLTLPSYISRINKGAFWKCSNLTSVEIGDSVTSIGIQAFYGCDSLTSITIPSNVTTIGNSAFSGCTSLTSVNILDGLKNIGDDAFSSCWSLTSVVIPDSVTSIGDHAFNYCESLTSVVIGDSVSSIGDYAFYGCYSLTSVKIGNGVTNIGDKAFGWSSDSPNVYIKDLVAWCNISFASNDSNPLNHGGNLYLNNKLLTDLVIPDSVTSIGDYAFFDCTSLTSVTIGNGVTSIGKYAFSYCSSLTSITIGNSVTSIGDYAFDGCTSLINITVDENNANYKSIDGNLYTKDGKILLQYAIGKTDTSFTIPDSVTSIGDYAFFDCTSLTSVTIGNGVTSIGKYAFFYCSSLTSVTFENTDGWWYSSRSSATSGTSILATDLANPTTAAKYLTSTYDYYYWKRT